jgi:GntR family transcriptional regulator, transcriptional repressor for pyruvate dehydrogenase complex
VTAQPLEHLSGAVLRPVRGHHAFEACVEQLATAIRLGVYPTGSTLPPERDLATRLGVSRATLREAMAALREAGFVETTRGRGGGTVVTRRGRGTFARRAARITPERRQDWLDALEFRRVVEPAAATLAARADLDDDQRANLQTAHDAVARAKSSGTHRQADSRYHLTVAALSRSPRTIEAVTSVQASLHEMLLSIPFLGANISHSHRQHRDLTSAILKGRIERARQVMEEHCDDTAALLRGFLG